jgi:4-amino-4-deoxy-L-arabinose transferase-like glycosyltransferase
MRSLRETSGPLEASIFVEGLRAIPATFLGIGLIAHALLWAIATQIAEPSPPPQMAVSLALGREWLLGYVGLPPLSAWVSEAIFSLTHSLFAIRLAAALCVAAAGWVSFQFARRVIGDRHGAIAVLLMVSVFPVAFPGSALTNDLLQMPLAAAAMYFWWLAAAEGKPNNWIPLGAIFGVMTYAGPHAFTLMLVLATITLLNARMRAVVSRFDAVLCIFCALLVFALFASPRLLWLWQHGWTNLIAGTEAGISPGERLSPLRLPFSILLGHFGFALILFLATANVAKDNAPVFIRERTSLSARRSVIALAIAPALIAWLASYALALPLRLQFFAPLLMLSGFAAVLIGGGKLTIRRQRLVGTVALIFLLAPVVMQFMFSFAPGWLGENRAANWPATAAARTFTEIYHTRTGRKLEYLVGERVSSAQIAAISADRPRLFIDADASRASWIDEADFKKKGGIVFWEIRGADNAPPAQLASKLPAFTEEAPLRLPWSRGGGDPVRLGWAIVPPQ